LRRLRRDEIDEAERAKVLEQHHEEIENLKRGPRAAKNTTENKRIKAVLASSISSGDTGENTEKDTQSQTDELSDEPRTRQAMPIQMSLKAKADWDYQKKFLNSQSQEIDTLMEMVGLESVKTKFLAMKAKVDLSVRQNMDLSRKRFGSVLLGNPGTGKTTVARLYAKFLAAVGIIPGHKIMETTGSRLANEGVSGCQKAIEGILKDGGGAIFIDEAYQLVQGSSSGGMHVLDSILAKVGNLTGKIVFILAGYQRPMEKFFAHNPGLPGRFPHELKFEDFDDTDLMHLLEGWIEKTYNKQMKVDDGLGGLYCRIVAGRIGCGRGRDGFANARAVENAMAKISERQSERLIQQKRQGAARVDYFFLDRQDIIGTDPSEALKSSKAWQRLQGMIGLDAVKKTVEALVDTIQYNYRRELDEQPLVGYSLNQVFLGNPGTGKTSIAKIYGQILVDLGFLSNGEGM